MESRNFGHLLMIPSYLGHAHTMSSLRLALALVKIGGTITFATRHDSFLRIREKQVFANLPNFHLVDLGETDQPIPMGPIGASRVMKILFEPYAEKLDSDRQAGVLGPTCVMVDRYLGSWVKDLAEKLKIPYYISFSNGGTYARLLQAVQQLCSSGSIRIEDDTFVNLEEVLNAPGLELMRPVDLPWALYIAPTAYMTIAEVMASAAGVVVNSFLELEAHAVSKFGETIDKDAKVPRLFTVGPNGCFSTELKDDESFVASVSHNSGSKYSQWLDTQPALSVLFICLGSWVPMFLPQIRELAQALEATDQRFLWVLPKRFGNFKDLKEALPPGFADKVGDKGMIITDWVSQVQVLDHTSVGGFLSHCGWQSCLESISAGVPILAWPQSAEQHFNARYVVDGLGIGVRLTEKRGDVAFKDDGTKRIPCSKLDGRDTLVKQDEFEKAFTLLTRGGSSITTKENVIRLRTQTKAAIAEGGSSQKALRELLHSFPTSEKASSRRAPAMNIRVSEEVTDDHLPFRATIMSSESKFVNEESCSKFI